MKLIVKLAVSLVFSTFFIIRVGQAAPVELYCSSQFGGGTVGHILPQEICYLSEQASLVADMIVIKTKDSSGCTEAFTWGRDTCYKIGPTNTYKILSSKPIRQNDLYGQLFHLVIQNVETGDVTFIREWRDEKSPYPVSGASDGVLGGLTAYYLTPGPHSPLRVAYDQRLNY